MAINVKEYIAAYLRTHKRLVIPQLGAFIVKTPGREVLFSELFKRDDGILRALLTDGGTGEIEAAGAIDRLVFDLRHAVQNGGEYVIDGLGAFKGGDNGALSFVYDPTAGLSPMQTAAPTSAPPHPTASSSAASGGTGSPADDRIGRRREARYGPDPCVKGLTYGRPVKTTDPYTLTGNKPARRVDKFIVVAVIAALLAIGAIVYGYLLESRTEKERMIYPEELPETAAGDGPSAMRTTE